MKMYLISDNIDTQIGMRLVGIDGCVAHDSETITAEIKKAVNEPGTWYFDIYGKSGGNG